LGQHKAAQRGVGGVLRQLDVVLRLEIAQAKPAVENHGRFRTRPNNLRPLDGIELVVYFACHLLEQIFHRHQTQNAAKLIHDHGHARAVRAHFNQHLARKLAFRHDQQFAQMAPQIECRHWRALLRAAIAVQHHPEYILDVHEAEHMIESRFINRQPRPLRRGKHGQRLIQPCSDRQRVHIWARRHDFAHAQLPQLHGA